LIHWALRREELCDPGLCPDAPDGGGRGDHCPLDKLDAAQTSAPGMLLRRAVDLRAAMKLGLRLDLTDVQADEFHCLLILEEEVQLLDAQKLNRNPG
jgi:hypothetical protein